MTIEAIFFGGIGAVAECADLDRKAWNAAFRANGLDWNWDWKTYQGLIATRDNRSVVDRFAARHDMVVPTAAIERGQTLHFSAMLAAGLPLRPGVAGVIKWAAQRGIRLGLVSRSQSEPVRSLLKATARARGGISFDVAILRSDLMHLPPHPDAYRLAVDHLALAPQSCLAVVDSTAALASADAAGIPTLGFPGALSRDNGLGVPGRGGEVHVLSADEISAAWMRSMRQAAE